MTVKQLKELIEGVDDDTLLVTATGDHEYNKAAVSLELAGVILEDGYIGEYYQNLEDGGWFEKPDKIIKVLVIS